MSLIEIVTLQPSEWREYKKLRLAALKQNPEAFGSTYKSNLEKPYSEWTDRLSDPKFIMLFARKGDELLGMAGAVLEENFAHILSVFVIQEARGQGISKLLMKELIRKIKLNTSLRKIELQVNPIQKTAVQLYKSFGFKETGVKKLMLGDGMEYDCYNMELNF
jgi:ribosomal protein S18 acetylase RimI-like enzyme